MKANHILTIGIAYDPVRGGVAAVEKTYSTFYEPFNHIATVVAGDNAIKKAVVAARSVMQFLWWMFFHPEVKIVHVHGSNNASFWRKCIFIYIAKSFGKKVIFHCHSGGFETFTHKHEYAVRKLIGRCDAVIALSEYWKSFFEKELGCNHVEVIKNVIPAPQYSHHPTSRFTLLFLGLLGQNKGIYDLLSVIADNKDVFNGELCLCIGGNGEVEKVKNLIKSYGISDMVEYEGWVSGNKKTDLLNCADAYILPSYKEGLPISILEAMSYALPIISTPVGGIPEIVKNGVNGYLVTPGNKEEIGQAIKHLMDSVEKRREMGRVSQRLVKEHLPIYVEKQLCELYRRVLIGESGDL